MNKKELKILEMAFEAEINSAIEKSGIPIIQTESKIAKKLAEDGYLKYVKLNFRGGLSVEGYQLTLAGHYAYCSSCGVA